MLGDLFYEAKGRITSKRVLDLEGPKIESSYFLEGKMRSEIEVIEIGTFTSIPTSEDAYFVEGKDIVTVKGNADETATVKAQGISKFNESSKVVSGSNFYRSSPNRKLSFLNNLVGIHEASVDKDGNISYKVWEWKHNLTDIKQNN
jgi:5-keto 4-deoxyuronate isomerase